MTSAPCTLTIPFHDKQQDKITSANPDRKGDAMSTITSLTASPVSIADVTPEMIDALKASATCNGWRSTTSKYLDVVTSRGVQRSIACWLMSDGRYEWRVWQSRNGWASANMTKEIQRIVEPEKFARSAARKAERKRAYGAVSGTVKVGSIFGGSFGYDATLWDFYQVVGISASGKTVEVRELAQETTSGYGPMCWRCRPVRDAFNGKTMKKRVDYAGTTPSITISSYESAWLMSDSEIERWHDADNYH